MGRYDRNFSFFFKQRAEETTHRYFYHRRRSSNGISSAEIRRARNFERCLKTGNERNLEFAFQNPRFQNPSSFPFKKKKKKKYPSIERAMYLG